MSLHARLGPSNHRWVHCPGSVREEEPYPDIPGAAAIDGTGSHELLELCLNNNVPADSYLDQIIAVNHEDMPGGWMVYPDRVERVNTCLNYITRRVKELTDQFENAVITVEAESQANPGGMFGRGDWWGTVDVTITVRHKHLGTCLFLEIIDYKDGRIWVNVPGNTQLLSYCGGKMRPFIASGPHLVRPFRPEMVGGCRITIVQPKTNPTIRYEDMTSLQVVDAVQELALAANRTDDPNAPLVAGKHCQWCKHNPKRGGSCNAEVEQNIEVIKNMTTDITAGVGSSLFELTDQLANPGAMPVEDLTKFADTRASMNALFDKAEAEIKLRIEAGINVPGYAMLPGKMSKTYSEDDKAIIKALKGRRVKQVDYFPQTLITPAALMSSKLLSDDQKKTFSKKYISEVAGKSSLKRVAYEKSAEKDVAMMFADVPATTIGIDMASGPDVSVEFEMVNGKVTQEIANGTVVDGEFVPKPTFDFGPGEEEISFI